MKRIVREKKTTFKIAVIGAKCVGKSALTVRIKTRKFIHNYAPNMESKCSFVSIIDGESVNMEVLDNAALQTAENVRLEDKIKWADAFILMYSITDESSLAALVASKCLINLYGKRRKKTGSSASDFLVALVGNKNDMDHERVISEEDGRRFAELNECTHFFELSTRESYDSVKTLFDNLYRAYIAKPSKQPGGLSPRVVGSPVDIPIEEDARLQATKQRARNRTTISHVSPNYTQTSPVTFRKIFEEGSACSSSPDDEHHFVGEQIIFDQSDLPPMSPSRYRRITVCSAPLISPTRKGFPHVVKRKQRKSTNTNEYSDSNNNDSKRFWT